MTGLNAGAQALKASGLTQREIAQHCGVASGTAGRWVQGLRVPSPELQQKLAQWVEPSLWPAPKQRVDKAKQDKRPAPLPGLPSDYVAPDYGTTNSATERELVAQCLSLHRVSAQLRDAPEFDVRQWLAVERQLTTSIRELAKYRQDLSPTAERNLLNTPTVQRLIKSILDALQPYPEASLAVIHALDGGEQT